MLRAPAARKRLKDGERCGGWIAKGRAALAWTKPAQQHLALFTIVPVPWHRQIAANHLQGVALPPCNGTRGQEEGTQIPRGQEQEGKGGERGMWGRTGRDPAGNVETLRFAGEDGRRSSPRHRANRVVWCWSGSCRRLLASAQEAWMGDGCVSPTPDLFLLCSSWVSRPSWLTTTLVTSALPPPGVASPMTAPTL